MAQNRASRHNLGRSELVQLLLKRGDPLGERALLGTLVGGLLNLETSNLGNQLLSLPLLLSLRVSNTNALLGL